MAEAIVEFEALLQQSESDALEFISSKVSSIRLLLQSQMGHDGLYPPLYECFYKCVQRKQHNVEVYKFALQFVPDVIAVYLHAVYESQPLLKANSETVLLSLLLESQCDKSVPPQVHVPALSKPSIYHQFSVLTSQPSLTESALSRHNQTEAVPAVPSFSGNEVTVNNRLDFLSSVVGIVTSHMTSFSHDTKEAFCRVCIRLSFQGMAPVFTSQILAVADLFAGVDLGRLRRYSVNDQFIAHLLHGVRMCLFQSSSEVAVKALKALQLRAEYEVLTSSIQLSHSLTRLLDGVSAEHLHFNVQDYSSYKDEGQSVFEKVPFNIHCTLNKQVVHIFMDEQSSKDTHIYSTTV